jgi:hypothetical protein
MWLRCQQPTFGVKVKHDRNITLVVIMIVPKHHLLWNN